MDAAPPPLPQPSVGLLMSLVSIHLSHPRDFSETRKRLEKSSRADHWARGEAGTDAGGVEAGGAGKGMWVGKSEGKGTSAEDGVLIGNLVACFKTGAVPALVPELVLALMDGDLDALDS